MIWFLRLTLAMPFAFVGMMLRVLGLLLAFVAQNIAGDLQ